MASEQDAFRTFLAERLVAFDPSIDISEGSAADTEVIQPTLDRLAPDPFDTPIEDFARQRLDSEFPDLVLQRGEPIDDLMVKPMRALIEPYRGQVVVIGNNQSIADPRILNETEADRLLRNYFETRRQGGFAIGTAKVFFGQPRAVTITPTNAVFTGSGLRFFPAEIQSISAESMLFNQEGNLFFFRVVVRAETQGTDFNIEPGTLIGIEALPEAVKVTNETRFEEGEARETTEQFISRVEGSLSEKSLVTFRGIRSRLFNLFDNIQAIAVVGFNDPEMNRDLVTGSPDGVYAFANLTAVSGSSSLFLAVGANFTDGLGNTDFGAAEVELGDTISRLNLTTGVISDFTVTELVSSFQLRVTPAPPNIGTAEPFWFKSKNRGQIFISDIPGGILVPQTTNGEIIVSNRQVHIGGHDDVYVRGGFPSERSIDLASIRDGEPLTFGLDMETFGADADEFVQVTPEITLQSTTDAAFTGPGNPQAEIIIKTFDSGDGTTPWLPTTEDIGRFLELIGPDFGLYEIQGILDDAVIGGFRTRRIQVSTFDEHSQAFVTIADQSSAFVLDFRIVEQVSVKSRVRDRDNPQVDFNGNSTGIGAEVGDSVVLETGSDAGIFSIRRILTHIGEDDTLVLDRELTSTVTPTGSGGGSGIRYRLDDELQVDLIEPRILKIPLGDIFVGGDLQTVAGSDIVLAGGTTNFLLAGVEDGDTLEIKEGDDSGEFEIIDVQAAQLQLGTPVQNTGFNLDFEVYRAFDGVERPLVRVKSIELLDSTNQPTGITIPYGDIIDARVLGTFANRAQGSVVESFKGEVLVGAPPLFTFEDTTVDFVARGVVAGYRLEIFEGDNINEYEIAAVNVGSNPNRISVIAATDGGLDFITAVVDLHYRVGLPSAGIARLYFLEPTSAELVTGIGGGRIQFEGDGQPLKFRFSEVDGRLVFPAPGAESADDPRDLRIVRSIDLGGSQFETILEITDPDNPDVFDSELQEGDLFEVFKQIPFKNLSGLTFLEAGVFGTPAGLRTIAGSNRVTVPANSRIDFTQMGDLGGQRLHIDSGPDLGQYTVNRIIDAKTLELNSVMTATTETITGLELGTPLDATLVNDPPVFMVDTTDSGQFGAIGDFIKIFEAEFPKAEGEFDIAAVDLPADRVELTGFAAADIGGTFAWVQYAAASSGGILEQSFSIYNAVATQAVVTQVAAKATDVKPLGTATIPGPGPLLTLSGVPGEFTGVVRGDRLEVLFGPNAGVYPIFGATTDTITLYTAQPFATAEVGATYRIWAGVYGSRRMVRVRGFGGTDGLFEPGLLIPYRIRRPGVFRISSTEMEDNEETGIFFVDVQVESLGPGDNRNLVEGSRLVVTSGASVDGYTYTVDNNVLTFSTFEEVTLNFDRRFLPVGNTDLPENLTEVNGRNLQIVYENSSVARIANDFLRSDADRTVVADPIARHFLPSFVFAEFLYEGGSSPQIVGPEIEAFINGQGPLDRLEVSDLEAFISRRGATFINHPILLVAVTHDVDRKLVVERSDNFIGGLNVPYNGTGRTSTFFARLGEGLTVERQ